MRRMSPEVALSGGSRMSALTPLLEVERTFVGRAENAAFDPEETLATPANGEQVVK